jgi:hypothetical protein
MGGAIPSAFDPPARRLFPPGASDRLVLAPGSLTGEAVEETACRSSHVCSVS